MEGILAASTDWKWYFDYVENNFDLQDADSWGLCRSVINQLTEVYNSFIKIKEIDNSIIVDTNNSILQDFDQISSYATGTLSINDCFDSMKTEVGKVLSLISHLAKLENASNETSYNYDYGMLIWNNYWELIDTSSLDEYKDELLLEADTIHLTDWDNIKQTVSDNLNHIDYPCSSEFIDTWEHKLVNVDIFSYQSVDIPDNCSWEEQYLLEMIKISLQEEQIKPIIAFSDSQYPDQSKWTEETIEHLIKYFHDDRTAFVLETIDFILHKKDVSKEVITRHLQLIKDYIESENKTIINTTSFKVIAMMFKEHKLKIVSGEDAFQAVIKLIQEFDKPDVIEQIKQMGFPVSKEQNNTLKNYAESYFENTNDITDIPAFLSFLENRKSVRFLSTKQLETINFIFVDLLNTDASIIIATMFYEYMSFLLEVNSSSTDIEKQKVHQYMINTQLLWETEYYHKQVDNLQEFSNKTEIKTADIKAFCDNAMTLPRIVANTIGLASESEICKQMELISKYPMAYYVTSYDLQSSFPIKQNAQTGRNHEISDLLIDYVTKITESKSYRFFNRLQSDTYVKGIQSAYRAKVRFVVSLLYKEKEMYEAVSSITETKLLDYNSELYLAHITQLFPVLEKKIRDLARNMGYFPFKKSVDDFMQYNDPSSILREIIISTCKGINGFDPVTDLYFVYNCMYNSSSLNVRNECIHGRGYETQNGLHFALRITLISILMIEQRIQIIHQNRRTNAFGND